MCIVISSDLRHSSVAFLRKAVVVRLLAGQESASMAYRHILSDFQPLLYTISHCNVSVFNEFLLTVQIATFKRFSFLKSRHSFKIDSGGDKFLFIWRRAVVQEVWERNSPLGFRGEVHQKLKQFADVIYRV